MVKRRRAYPAFRMEYLFNTDISLSAAAGCIILAAFLVPSKSFTLFVGTGTFFGATSAVAIELFLHSEALWIILGATLCTIVAFQTTRESEFVLNLFSEGHNSF